MSGNQCQASCCDEANRIISTVEDNERRLVTHPVSCRLRVVRDGKAGYLFYMIILLLLSYLFALPSVFVFLFRTSDVFFYHFPILAFRLVLPPGLICLLFAGFYPLYRAFAVLNIGSVISFLNNCPFVPCEKLLFRYPE